MRVFNAAAILSLSVITFALGGGAGTPKKEDVPKYLAILKTSPNAKDRARAAEMLGKRAAVRVQDVESAIEPLKKALEKDIDLDVRRAAAYALGNIGPDPASTVPLLIGALKEKHAGLKLAAINALSNYGDKAKEALPALREIQKEKTDKLLSKAATAAIQSITGKKKS